MSDTRADRGNRLRRILVRSGLVLLYVLLVGLTFVFGKGHTLLIDNKDAAGGAIPAIDGVLVSVDGREALELYKGDRDMALLKGQRHRVSVEFLSGGEKIEKSFRLPMDVDMLLLSVPKLVAGQDAYIETFVLRDQPRPADEQVGNTNAFTSPDAPVAPDAAPPAPPAP
jgi:hypothetical protein